METKLTLRLKKRVIVRAKKYASDHDTSLSKLVENYLSAITEESSQKDEISPLVSSLSRVITFSIGEEAGSTYHQHLEEKYL